MSEDNKLSFCRLAWKIAGYPKGHGEWFDNTPKNVAMLQSHVVPLNNKYGAGTHRIEYDDGDKSRKKAEGIIKKISAGNKCVLSM